MLIKDIITDLVGEKNWTALQNKQADAKSCRIGPARHLTRQSFETNGVGFDGFRAQGTS